VKIGMMIAAALMAACGVPRDAAPRVGAPAPDYGATTLDGHPTTLKGLEGRPVLLNVWATWCHPCRKEMPDLQRLHRERGPRGLQVVGVSIDERGQEAAIRDFLREFGITYPIWLDPEDQVSPTFALIGVPGTFLIGRDGILLWSHVGPISATDAALNRAIDQALGGR
jgi:cytochrome c biogenesis protein CcmG, thiol:disulfide interchange protein DsbE